MKRTHLNLEQLERRDCPAMTIQLDFDTFPNAFFNDPAQGAARRAIVQRAADTLGSLIDDHAAAITPGGTNNWTVWWPNPNTGFQGTLTNVTVPTDTVKIFVRAETLDGPGQVGGRAGIYYNVSGTQAFLDAVQRRGKPASTYTPGVGQVIFDITDNWYAGVAAEGRPNNQFDLLSTAMHEIGHVLLGSHPLSNGEDPAHHPANTRDAEGFQASMEASNNSGRVLFNRHDLNALAGVWNLVRDPDAAMGGAVSTNLGPAAGSWSTTTRLSNAVDVDMYRIQAQAGQRLTLTTSAVTGGAAVDTYLRLFDANGREVRAANTGTYDTLTYTFAAGGTYYVGVSSSPNVAYSAVDPLSRVLAGGTGDFNLRIDLGATTPAPDPSAPTVTAGVFGGEVWRFREGTGWRQLLNPNTSARAQQVAVSADAAVVVGDFGTGGLWRHRDSTGWQRLSTLNAEQIGLDGSGGVVADFGGNGLWRYRDGPGWQQLGTGNPQQFAVAANGDVVGDYGTGGLYRFRDGPGWVQLTTSDAQQIAVGVNGDVAAGFSDGVWLYRNNAWQRVSPDRPQQLIVTAAGDVVGDFGGLGVRRYRNGTWQQIATADPEQLAAGTNGDVLADFGTGGLLRYRDGELWALMVTSSNAEQFAAG